MPILHCFFLLNVNWPHHPSWKGNEYKMMKKKKKIIKKQIFDVNTQRVEKANSRKTEKNPK